MTDLCYVACTRKLLAARARLYPQFATHNALTVASVIEYAGGVEGYEFQRLHGMGEVLYDLLLADHPAAAVSGLRAGRRPPRPSGVSGPSPAGEWRQLLVCVGRRRSFGADRLDSRGVRRTGLGTRDTRAIARMPLPRDLYAPDRRNSSGVEFGDRASLDALLGEIRDGKMPEAMPRRSIDGSVHAGAERVIHSPIDGTAIGRVSEADDAIAAAAMAAAQVRLCRLGGDSG